MSVTRALLLGVLYVFALAACEDDRSPGTEPDAAGEAAPSSIDRLYSLPSIAGTTPEAAVWSPDGSALAFAWNDQGFAFRDVWMHSVEGARNVRLTRHGERRDPDSEHAGVTEIAWLGDSERLVYVLDGAAYWLDGSGNSELVSEARSDVHSLKVAPGGQWLAYLAQGKLWVKDIAAGEPARAIVDPAQERVFIERYEWSADGQRLAFVETDNREVRQIEIHYYSGGEQKTHRTTRAFPGDETPKRRVGVVSSEGGTIRWFERTDPQDPVWGFGLSSDGSRLFIDSSDFLIKKRTVDTYDVASGDRQVFFRSEDPRNVSPAWAAAWAPADDGLIILSDHDGWFHLFHQSEPGGTPRQLTSGEWEVASFHVDPASGSVYFLANETHRAELQLYRVPIEGGPIQRITRPAGTHAPVFAPDHTLMADRFSNDTSPPELYLQSLTNDAEARRITHSPRPEFSQLPLAKVSYVNFTSHRDGAPLIGRLSVPRDFDPGRKYPLIMGSIYPNSVRNRWGAGNAIPTWGLDQHLVERGYLVMKVDVRGSWGHGKEIRQGLFRDYGGMDKEDVHSGALHLIEAGYVDSGRVGMWGWSYGGLMTLMSMFHKPDVYAVGIADAPATNVAHAFPEQMWVMGRPEGEDFPERYRRMSALYHSDGLTKPVMITHATKDAVVLYSDTIALVEKLIQNGKQFELVTLPGSSHIWANDSKDQQRFGYKKMVEFLDRHLKPEE